MSPIRPFRRFCLACLEPDRSVKVVEGGRAATVCACGNSVVRAAVEGEEGGRGVGKEV